jgi:hypothetical protein
MGPSPARPGRLLIGEAENLLKGEPQGDARPGVKTQSRCDRAVTVEVEAGYEYLADERVGRGADARPQCRPALCAARCGDVDERGEGWVYLLMLLGHSGVKADTWIVRFVEDALGRRSSPKEAEALINAAAADLAVDATALDHAIWRHMSTRRRKRGAS